MRSAASPETLPGFDLLEQTPIIIENIIVAATPDVLHWKLKPDRWSIGEVLGHLAEQEQVFFARARRMVEEKHPALESYDQNGAAAAGRYSGDAKGNLRRFCHERDLSLSWLRYLPPVAVSRTGVHSAIGPITLNQLLNEWAFHDLGHIRQIAELYRARAFFPKIGPFQQYYTLNP